MDRRTQRYVLVLLLVALALLLYRSLGTADTYGAALYRAGSGGVRQEQGPGELDLRDIEPANATLGVCGRCARRRPIRKRS